MTRNYVGLACSGHDNAIAIVDSTGQVRFAEAAERYLQNKRALDSPPDDLIRSSELVEAYCEPDAELVLARSWSEEAFEINQAASAVVVATLQGLRDYRVKALSGRTARFIDFTIARLRGRLHIVQLAKRATAYAGRNLAERCGARDISFRSYDHHLSHAATACFASPFSEAACAIVDGIGEGRSVSFFRYSDGRIQPLDSPEHCNETAGDQPSLGLFYSDLAMLCGFDPWKGEEWKVMGLAPYGQYDASIHRLFKGFLRVEGSRLVRPDSASTSLLRLFQKARPPGRPILEAANLARTGQHFFEELLIELCNNLRGRGISDNLVLGGGCALNSSMNGRLLSATGFANLFVPSAPGDDGNAVGSALLAFYEDNPDARPPQSVLTPYLGSSISRTSLARAAQSGSFAYVERLEPAALVACVARRLCDGELVGWMQGRAEFGPRALGNRSILADPRRAEMKAKINMAVKFREEFRPFAPAVLEERANEYFHSYQPAPYMERTLTWREEVRSRVPAVVHVDGTGRLQTVSPASNPQFYALIRAFHELSGVPVLLNTSFNIMGKPIVHSIEDAMAVFVTSGLDALVIEDHVFAKRPPDAPQYRA